MDLELLVANGEVIAYALTGVLAIIVLLVVQLFRRRADVKKARESVRLVTYSIAEPRIGPIAVRGRYRDKPDPRIDHGDHRIYIQGVPDVQRGTRAHWKAGARTYMLREGDSTIAIGVMSKRGESGNEWTIVASPGESGVQLYAAEPRPAPPPLFPWRVLIFMAICGSISFFGLYGVGTVVVDAPRDCSEATVARLQVASALPLVRDEALARLERCHK